MPHQDIQFKAQIELYPKWGEGYVIHMIVKSKDVHGELQEYHRQQPISLEMFLSRGVAERALERVTHELLRFVDEENRKREDPFVQLARDCADAAGERKKEQDSLAAALIKTADDD